LRIAVFVRHLGRQVSRRQLACRARLMTVGRIEQQLCYRPTFGVLWVAILTAWASFIEQRGATKPSACSVPCPPK